MSTNNIDGLNFDKRKSELLEKQNELLKKKNQITFKKNSGKKLLKRVPVS